MCYNPESTSKYTSRWTC